MASQRRWIGSSPRTTLSPFPFSFHQPRCTRLPMAAALESLPHFDAQRGCDFRGERVRVLSPLETAEVNARRRQIHSLPLLQFQADFAVPGLAGARVGHAD